MLFNNLRLTQYMYSVIFSALSSNILYSYVHTLVLCLYFSGSYITASPSDHKHSREICAIAVHRW